MAAKHRRRRQRYTYAQQTVAAYMNYGETYKAAKERLDQLWAIGKHPAQNAQRSR